MTLELANGPRMLWRGVSVRQLGDRFARVIELVNAGSLARRLLKLIDSQDVAGGVPGGGLPLWRAKCDCTIGSGRRPRGPRRIDHARGPVALVLPVSSPVVKIVGPSPTPSPQRLPERPSHSLRVGDEFPDVILFLSISSCSAADASNLACIVACRSAARRSNLVINIWVR